MAIVRLPFGEGLERSKGVMVVSPVSFEDLRNVFLFDGKAQVRQGLDLRSVLVDDVAAALDITLMLAPFRSESASVGVGFDDASKEVWLNRLDIDGTNPSNIGSLGTLDAGITFDPPIIVGADSDNKMFLAHDEPNPTSRLTTQIYNPGGAPQITNLTADLDGNGDADVKFRGVVRHLSYIFGWGYGSASDPVRGDVVRVSNSGDSKIFEDFAFFEAGQQGETVMVCRSAGPSLMVFKETETYEIFGYSPDTFGIRLADSLFGCVGSRLAVSVAGTVFFWSTQGPRISSGGPSVDIAVPLDIGGPDPATLVAESEPFDAFVEYDPRTRVVNFVWGQRVYALSIRDPNKPRWSYYELGETAQCAGLFFITQSTAGGGGPPVGAPEALIIDAHAQAAVVIAAPETGGISPINGETVTIDGKVYTWQTVLTNVDGNLQIDADVQICANSLFGAITLGPGSGTLYAAATTLHPTVGLGSLANAGPPRVTVIADAAGVAGDGIACTTTMVQDPISGVFRSGPGPSFTPDTSLPITELQDGVANNPTSIPIIFENVGQLGAEDIEVWVSDDAGANYVFSSLFPANAQQFQEILVTLENFDTGKLIQPLTDYKFSLRYRLGGQFSPGYTDPDPDLWDTPEFDSQQTTQTPAGDIFLPSRLGNNGGYWDRRDTDETLWRVSGAGGGFLPLPAGHELMDIEVFLETQDIDEDPDQFSGTTKGTPRTADALHLTYADGDFGYPSMLEFTPENTSRPSGGFEPGFNLYKFRFSNGANKGAFSNVLDVYGGPDMPLRNSLNSFQVVQTPFSLSLATMTVSWSNAQATPDILRVCPPGDTAPNAHFTEIWLRNVTQASSWVLIATVDQHIATKVQAFNSGTLPVANGDTMRCGIRHKTLCFNPGFPSFGVYYSEWSLNDGSPNYIETVSVF
jgi:hypothetical protein